MHAVFPIRRSTFRNRPAVAGFTLIEMMIVITILAIIVALAYPAYMEQVRKARRADAVNTLMSSAQYLERCFTRFNAYNSASCASPAGDSIDEYYNLTVVRTATTFTLTATPKPGTDQAKDNCGALTLDYLGNKTPAPGSNRCWAQS